MTAAARKDGIALFLAAVHACDPSLVEASDRRITHLPFASGAALLAWAETDPAVAGVARALGPRTRNAVRELLDGMLRR